MRDKNSNTAERITRNKLSSSVPYLPIINSRYLYASLNKKFIIKMSLPFKVILQRVYQSQVKKSIKYTKIQKMLLLN